MDFGAKLYTVEPRHIDIREYNKRLNGGLDQIFKGLLPVAKKNNFIGILKSSKNLCQYFLIILIVFYNYDRPAFIHKSIDKCRQVRYINKTTL